jgi:signal transduction histidine kinase
MSGAAPVPAASANDLRRGLAGGLLGLARATVFFALMLAGAGVLVLALAWPVLAVLGLGHLVEGMLTHGIGLGGEDTRDLLGGVIGLIGCRFVLPPALLAARSLAERTRSLSLRWCAVPIASAYRPAPQPAPDDLGRRRLSYRQRMNWLLEDAATWRDLLWLAVNTLAGWVLLMVPVTLVVVGVFTFITPALTSVAWVHRMLGLPPGDTLVAPPAFPGNTPIALFVIGVAMVALGVWAAPWMLRGYAGVARAILSPSDQAQLELRVMHLDKTRRETLDTGAAELRRIERDLHDGAQARLVAMGLTLDAAGRLIETDPAAARALLIEARDASAKALAELRDLVRGIHPPVLADRGLADAVRALALDSPLRVQVSDDLPGRPPAPVESAAYFAVSELLANVAKHSGTRAAAVDMRYSAGALRISVADNGTGGADASRGTGLSGIERRLDAFDGVLALSSPVGGPTVVTLEVPCALS